MDYKRNEMMDRPVIKPEVRDFLRQGQKQTPGMLGAIQADAKERRVPVIPHETVVFFDWLLDQLQPEKVLEVGTAIGFSTLLIAERIPENGHVTTIDRNPKMIQEAKENFAKSQAGHKIELLEGEAADILKNLSEHKQAYDMVFMDSAKAKYYEFFPYCMEVLKKDGLLIVDDVLQAGTILDDETEIPKRVRKIHRMLNKFLDVVLDHPALKSSLLPLGDGLLLITKKDDYDFSFMKAK